MGKKLVIFASGRGSNAEKIIDHFRSVPEVEVAYIISNKKEAGVLDLALRNGIPSRVISRKVFYQSSDLRDFLKDLNPEFIILAGFLWLMPKELIQVFPQKIINIHPSLLPKYGGKGMYGSKVHQAVKAAGEKESGITIHFVNEEYDKGKQIAQFKTELSQSMNAEDIAAAVLNLEHQHFAPTIEKLLFTK